MAESSPAPVVGANRTAVLGSSTPAMQRFRGSWKPRYAERTCSCSSLFYVYFVSLGFFIVQCVFLEYNAHPWDV
jgi:hypothetical protein